MDQEIADVVIGAAILVPFLIVVFAAGFALNRLKNRRFHAAWRPLVPVINGVVVDDGGGAASSALVGTFAGRRVRAGMMPSRRRNDYVSSTFHHFDIALDGVAGPCNWQLVYALPPGGLTPGWRLIAEDTALVLPLQQAGVLEIVEELRAGAGGHLPPGPIAQYMKRTGTLTYCEDAGQEWLPTPDRFRRQLGLMIRLADAAAGLGRPGVTSASAEPRRSASQTFEIVSELLPF